MKQKPIYVEVPIEADIEHVWDASQKPELHEQWDLRFSSITYLPKEEGQPQQFTYSRAVGPLLKVEGWGKSIGTHHKDDGTRSSSLHFGTDQWFSPIREGRGYWKYEPQKNSVTFLTQYDYDVNFGRFGKLVDRFTFRPLIGWGTALSFDVLKRWLEKGEAPRSQYLRFFSTYLMTLLFAFIWLYQGLIPKIIGMHPEERAMVGNSFALSDNQITIAVLIIGALEVLFGLLWLCYPRKKQLFALQLILFPLLTIAAVIAVPSTAVHPFNPVTFNLALIVLSAIGFFVSKDVPTAKVVREKGDDMSIYKKVMGRDFALLHPMLQKRYDLSDGATFKASGVMHEIKAGQNGYPLFRIGVRWKLLFPEHGKSIPFSIRNTAFTTKAGDSHVHWERIFQFQHTNRYFNALMSLDEKRLVIKDYLRGTPSFYSDLAFTVTEDGALKIESLNQRLVLGKLEIPLPRFLHGLATVTEKYIDAQELYQITVTVRNPLIGSVFSYEGTFSPDEKS